MAKCLYSEFLLPFAIRNESFAIPCPMNASSAVAHFRAHYPDVEPLAIVRAPGRVNLIGEHIDYNDGIVLPIAINLETRVVIGRTGDGRLRVRSAAERDELDYDLEAIPEHAAQSWDAYVRGVASSLVWRGKLLVGCAVWIESDIPPAAGLSSSAALELGIALALNAAARKSMPMRAVADLCRYAEHRFAGVPCGIMDQYACALAKEGHALAIDCRDLSISHVTWPASNPAVLIVDTGMKRSLAAGAYAERVRECEEALRRVRTQEGVQGWRDVAPPHIVAAAIEWNELLRRRARHIVTENNRSQQTIAAMQQDDCARFGELMNASHASLRDDYEVSTPEIDRLVTHLQTLPGVYGAKLTGAGFGGCVVALVDRVKTESVKSAISELGGSLRMYETMPMAGAGAAFL